MYNVIASDDDSDLSDFEIEVQRPTWSRKEKKKKSEDQRQGDQLYKQHGHGRVTLNKKGVGVADVTRHKDIKKESARCNKPRKGLQQCKVRPCVISDQPDSIGAQKENTNLNRNVFNCVQRDPNCASENIQLGRASIPVRLRVGLDVNLNIKLVSTPRRRSEEAVSLTSPKKRKQFYMSTPSSGSQSSDSDVVQVVSPRKKARQVNSSPLLVLDSFEDCDWTDRTKAKRAAHQQSSDLDVICIDSDSDLEEISTSVPVGNVPLPPLKIDPSERYVHEPVDNSDSDVSDLPEIDIQSSDTLFESSGVDRFQCLQSWNDQIQALRTNHIDTCTLTGTAEGTEESFLVSDRYKVKVKEEECVYAQECHQDRTSTSLASNDRLRNKSGESVDYSANETAVDACWQALFSTPCDMKPADQSVRKKSQNHCVSHTFSRYKQNTISSCQEEGFRHVAVAMAKVFTTTAHKPCPKLLQELLHENLKTCSSNFTEGYAAYHCLKHIQRLHHPTAQDLPIEWRHIQCLVESLMTSVPSTNQPGILKWHLDLHCLKYLVSVFEDDIERKTRWGTLRKSFLTTLLNPESCRGQCQEVIRWLGKLVSLVEPSSPRRHACPDPSDYPGRITSPPVSCGCQEELCHQNCVLPALQKLLEMSFRLTTSWNQREYVVKVVDELNTPSLRGVRQIQLLIETIQPDLLRLRLADRVFHAHFEMDILPQGTSWRESVSISCIVNEYFFYVPKIITVGRGGLDDDEGEVVEGKEKAWTREEEVEEMVYLLLVLLQSYLKCYADCRVSSEGIKPGASLSPDLFTSRRTLSEEDQICVLEIGEHVDRLRGHVRSLCHGHISVMTRLYINQMSTLYEWMYIYCGAS